MSIKKFIGTGVALITPFNKDFSIDYDSLEKLVEFNIANGIDYLVINGTTGESPTVNASEREKIINTVVSVNNNRVPLVLGMGGNDTVRLVKEINSLDLTSVSAILSVSPYYNKPTQEGLFQHYKKINDKVGIPIIIYNIPSRSVIDMSVETMARLFELKNIAGVKDATGDLNRAVQQHKVMGDEFIMLTGEDGNALEFNSKGGCGCISVTANVAAKLCSEMQSASLKKNDDKLMKRANDINKLLTPLNKSLFIESNPSPVKYAASLLKLSPDEVRLPLVKITDPTKTAVLEALKYAHLI